jgi:hypothetical protein
VSCSSESPQGPCALRKQKRDGDGSDQPTHEDATANLSEIGSTGRNPVRNIKSTPVLLNLSQFGVRGTSADHAFAVKTHEAFHRSQRDDSRLNDVM